MKDGDSSIIKAQEWMVRFDGQIKRSDMSIDSESHHMKIKSKERN